MTPDDIYRHPMDIAWTFDYELSEDKVEDLYKRAKQNQWDSDEHLPWDTQVDPSKPLINARSDVYHQMPFFKKLSKSQQETFTAHSTAQLLSQFLHGEQGALMTAACVTHSVPDATAKLYAATQTMDEARHVEVYARYCDKIAMVYPMSPWLKALIDATLKSDRYEKVMIGMNMIVEGLALGAFNNMYRTTDLRAAEEADLQRHARRVAARLVRSRLPRPGDRQAATRPSARSWPTSPSRRSTSSSRRRRPAAAIGQPRRSRLPGGARQQRHRPRGLLQGHAGGARTPGSSQELPPGQIHSLKDLMMPALARVGLITPTVRKKYEDAGIPIFDDPARARGDGRRPPGRGLTLGGQGGRPIGEAGRRRRRTCERSHSAEPRPIPQCSAPSSTACPRRSSSPSRTARSCSSTAPPIGLFGYAAAEAVGAEHHHAGAAAARPPGRCRSSGCNAGRPSRRANSRASSISSPAASDGREMPVEVRVVRGDVAGERALLHHRPRQHRPPPRADRRSRRPTCAPRASC